MASVALSAANWCVPARAQQEQTLDASRGRFQDAGVRVRVIRLGPDGLYYLLTAGTPEPVPATRTTSNRSKDFSKGANRETRPAPVVRVFDLQGKQVREVPGELGSNDVVSASALDLDRAGRVYIADQAGNAVDIYTALGAPFAHFRVSEPTQIVALPGDRFAVCSANADRLIAVYDLHGALLRQFGELSDLSDDSELNQRLNQGYLASDNGGNLYFSFRYLPEPTVRKYDSDSGSLLDEFSLTTPDFEPMAQSARQEIARMESGKAVLPHEIVSAIAVDPATQELWLALGNLIMHFDNANNNTASGRAYTTAGARMVPSFILPEKDDLLAGNTELGTYEFSRHFEKIRTLK